jgi:hypothetical protein
MNWHSAVIVIASGLLGIIAGLIAGHRYKRALWQRKHPGMDYDAWRKTLR